MGIFGGLPTAVGQKTEKTVIAKGTLIRGEMETEALLLLDGTWEGEIRSTTEVSIGANGQFKGQLSAKRVIINGKLEGTVHCDKLEILKNGLVEGEVQLREFTIEPGGRFFGQSRQAEEDAPMPRLLTAVASA
jgi:cytoskeletal protein CcmA (bactofilin family)